MSTHKFIIGDVIPALKTLPSGSVHCIVTSPPYYNLRKYTKGANKNELGREDTPEEYIKKLGDVFDECKRVLREDGVLFLNLGDAYWKSGRKHPYLKPKDLVGIPWAVAFELRRRGWYLRNDNVWKKDNCVPFPATDRFVNTHEFVFLLAKSERYYFDWFAVSEPVKITTIQRATRGRGSPTNKYQNVVDGEFGQKKQGIHTNITPHSKEKIPAKFGIQNYEIAYGGKKYPDEVGGIYSGCGYELTSRRRKRDVWQFATASFPGQHYAVFPTEVPEAGIKAGTSDHGCCPVCGAAFERLLSKDEADEEWKRACGANSEGEYYGESVKEYADHGAQDPSDMKRRILEGMKTINTVGWNPRCKCGREDTVPCTALDPFVGSGTTSMVAKEHNRNSIGIDLDPNNIPIQKKRMGFVDSQNRLVEDCEWIIL